MKHIFIMLCFCLALNASAQDAEIQKPKPFSKENAFIGGSGTLNVFNIGKTAVIAGINPMYGYYVKDWLDVAGVVNLQYNSFELDPAALNNGLQKKTFMVGVGASSRLYLFDIFYLQVQPEANIIFAKETPIFTSGTAANTNKYTQVVPSVLVGAGMKRGFSKGKTYGWASILFDVAANKNSPYRNISLLPGTTGDVIPILRFGMNILLSDIKKNNN